MSTRNFSRIDDAIKCARDLHEELGGLWPVAIWRARGCYTVSDDWSEEVEPILYINGGLTHSLGNAA